MSLELEQMQQKLDNAIDRLQQLEETVKRVQEASRWRHLITRPNTWRRQLAMRDKWITVGQLVSTIRANNLSVEEASADLDLPVEAIQEALEYYEQNRELIQAEAAEERQWLAERGYLLEPKDLPR